MPNLLRFHLLLYLSLLFFSCNSQSQIKPVKELKSKLSSEKAPRQYNSGDLVHAGLLDKSGNLWFVTSNEGVYKYDGVKFTNFRKADGLCNENVSSILEDTKGDLWFGTADGICKYDGKTFTHIPIPWFRHEGANTVMDLFQDKDENIWIGTWGGGAYCYDGKEFKSFLQEAGRQQSDGNYNNAIKCIITDNEDNIWFSSLTHGGITSYDGEDFVNYSEEDGLCNDMVFTSFLDSKGDIWIGVIEDGDLCRYDGKTFNHYTKLDGTCFNFVSCFYEDKSGNIWFGSETGKGLCIYNGKNFTSFSVEGSGELPVVRFITEDNKGNIWFGGREGSLWRYDGEILTDYTHKKYTG